MTLCSVALLLARIKIKLHHAGGEPSWGALFGLAVFVAAVWFVIYLLQQWAKSAQQRGSVARKESVRASVELARMKGCVDSAEKCWFCGGQADGRAVVVPLNNHGPSHVMQWEVKKIPVFCCEKCQSKLDVALLSGHPRISSLLLEDFTFGTGG